MKHVRLTCGFNKLMMMIIMCTLYLHISVITEEEENKFYR